MSAISGIGVSADLSAKFSRAVDDRQTRFIKVSIQNEESLVHDLSVPIGGSLQEDLAQLQNSDEIIQENTPAYLLTKLDDPPAEWLVIYYVPDTAKVRDKMLYASSRASLLKSLGSTLFSDSIFATSKADLTPEAYAAHRKHVMAPKPLSASEQEMADVRAAERQAGGLSVYQGSRARTTHIGKTIGMPWAADLEDAVKDLSEGDDSVLVVATIDMASETLVLHSTSPTAAGDVGASLPPDGASYAFFAWKHALSRRDVVFIYSCPSSCPVKHRMVYASGFNAVFIAAQTLLADSPSPLHSRKIETSTPAEIDEAFLRSELDFSSGQGTPGSGAATPAGNDEEKKPFARPRGPKRR
ncbi:Protein tyrosine kinase [Mycena venus]|uniref:Protein tyrosine kinase n=1 Tax=Mycena venus TaxID=2733690 RepID=A0A8H7CX72_9AGAR|nr:Protein tyrosine kinase [Mycena venus]